MGHSIILYGAITIAAHSLYVRILSIARSANVSLDKHFTSRRALLHRFRTESISYQVVY